MPKQYRVDRDQAVWERETFWIEVPDEVPADEIDEYLYDKIEDGVTRANYTEIRDAVEGCDVQITIEACDEN